MVVVAVAPRVMPTDLAAATRLVMEVVAMAGVTEEVVAAAAEVVGIDGYFQRIACFSMPCHDSPASAKVRTVLATT